MQHIFLRNETQAYGVSIFTRTCVFPLSKLWNGCGFSQHLVIFYACIAPSITMHLFISWDKM